MTPVPHFAALDDDVGDPRRRLKIRLTNIAIDAFLIAFSLSMLLPLVFLIANAFKTPQEILLWRPSFARSDLDNFTSCSARRRC